jgi:hypothetical protein
MVFRRCRDSGIREKPVQYCTNLISDMGGVRYTPPTLCVSNRSYPPTRDQGGIPDTPLLRPEMCLKWGCRAVCGKMLYVGK